MPGCCTCSMSFLPLVARTPTSDGLADLVFDATDRVLHVALEFLGAAFAFHLAVAEHFARRLLCRARDFLRRAFDTIFVDHRSLLSRVVGARDRRQLSQYLGAAAVIDGKE